MGAKATRAFTKLIDELLQDPKIRAAFPGDDEEMQAARKRIIRQFKKDMKRRKQMRRKCPKRETRTGIGIVVSVGMRPPFIIEDEP